MRSGGAVRPQGGMHLVDEADQHLVLMVDFGDADAEFVTPFEQGHGGVSCVARPCAGARPNWKPPSVPRKSMTKFWPGLSVTVVELS